MITLNVEAPTVNKRPKSNGKPKRGPDGKLAPTKERPVWLNSNQRLNHHQRAKWVKLWREAGMRAAIDNDLPVLRGTPHGRWFCVATIHLPRNTSYDAGNFYPTIKPIIDGIVTDYGFLTDDSNEHFVGPLNVEGATASGKLGGVVLSLFDMTVTADRESLLEWIR